MAHSLDSAFAKGQSSVPSTTSGGSQLWVALAVSPSSGLSGYCTYACTHIHADRQTQDNKDALTYIGTHTNTTQMNTDMYNTDTHTHSSDNDQPPFQCGYQSTMLNS